MAYADTKINRDAVITALNKGDKVSATNYLLPLAKQGIAEAQFMLVSVLQDSDQAQAGYWLRKAAENKHPDACLILGVMYLQGIGVAEDLEMAKKWLLIAASNGVTAAQLHLGILYRTGPMQSQDEHEAFKWMKQAAEDGNAEAQFRLAELYRYGYGVGADPAQTERWLHQAAKQGHLEATQSLERQSQ